MKNFLDIFKLKNRKDSRLESLENRVKDIEIGVEAIYTIISRQAEMISVLAQIQSDIVTYMCDNEMLSNKNKKISSGIILLEPIDDDGFVN